MNTSAGTPLEDRPVRALGFETHQGWHLKLYAITLPGEQLQEWVLPAVRQILDRIAPAPADDSVGFVVVHQGRDAVWLLVDLWHGDILHQTTLCAGNDVASTPRFSAVPPGGPTACVWELPVLAHERDAYVEHILQQPDGQIDAYLDAGINGPIGTRRTHARRSHAERSEEAVMPDDITWIEAERLIKTAEMAFSTADVPAILELFHDDIVARYAGLPEVRGLQAMRDLLEARFERQRDYRVEKTLRVVSGDLVADSWTGQWTDAHTGERMVGTGMEIFRLRNGRVIELDAVFHGWSRADIDAGKQIV